MCVCVCVYLFIYIYIYVILSDPVTGPVWPREWVEVYLYSSMTAALEGGEWSAARPGRTLFPGKTRYSFYRRLVGPQGRSGRAENLVPTGIPSRTVQPLIILYTDWATGPTHTHTHTHVYIYTKFQYVIFKWQDHLEDATTDETIIQKLSLTSQITKLWTPMASINSMNKLLGVFTTLRRGN